MTEKYLAHISKTGDEQPLIEHLKNTAKLAGEFATVLGAKEQAELCGLLHDIGKYSKEFQKRLHGGPKVDHAAAGAFESHKVKDDFTSICIAGHHSGLPDRGGKTDTAGSGTFIGRIKKAEAGLIPDYSPWQTEIPAPKISKVPSPAYCTENQLSKIFFIRMLYSCLTDADFLDTEAFMSGSSVNRGCNVDMDELDCRLTQYLNRWTPSANHLNEVRTAIRQSCEKVGMESGKGLFTLTVPTGGGKTISSLDFAVKHAKANGMDRIIYVIPYTSIIDQTAEIFTEIFGNEIVLEHHSGVDWDAADDDEETNKINEKMRLAAENWDMPIIVTTAVQFFESLFASKSSKCRKLHNIANSVVIFDEAQLLPIPYLSPCIFAVTELVQNYGVSAVLCTATQPALRKFIQDFRPLMESREICPSELSADPIFQRVIFDHIGSLEDDALVKKLLNEQQVLCVVNTRKKALTLFEILLEGGMEGCFHLSTYMIPQHRKKALEEIRSRLKNGLPCRVISTSLIEAGVDVDFPIVYRQECGLDSVLQAGGRCNREGKRPLEESFVHVFGDGKKEPQYIKKPSSTFQRTERKFPNAWSSSEAVSFYFNQLVYVSEETEFDENKIVEIMKDEPFSFRTIAEKFHLIDGQDSAAVYIPIGEGKELIEKIRKGAADKSDYRKLNQYGVSIYRNCVEDLLRSGVIEEMDQGFYVLSDMSRYSETTGLSLRSDYGVGIFA